jgi:hypothetical protein
MEYDEEYKKIFKDDEREEEIEQKKNLKILKTLV